MMDGTHAPAGICTPLTESAILLFKISTYDMALLILGTAIFLSTCRNILSHYKQGQHLDAFRLEAGIYVGCFLLMNTHDYRLIFLTFTIPLLIEWIHSKGNRIWSVPFVTLTAMVFSMWSFFVMRFLGRNITFVMEVSFNWVMLATLLYLLFASTPEWLRGYIPLNSGKQKIRDYFTCILMYYTLV